MQAQPSHHFPAVRRVVDAGRPVRRPMKERRKLRAGHRRPPFLPRVVHAVQHGDISRPWDTDADVAFRIRNEDLAHRSARHPGRHPDARRGVGRAEVAHSRRATPYRIECLFTRRFDGPPVHHQGIREGDPCARSVESAPTRHILVMRRLGRGAPLRNDKPWPEHLMRRLGLGVDRGCRQSFQPDQFVTIRDS